MDAGALGAEIVLAGKVTGARSRVEKFNRGYIKHNGEPAEEIVDHGQGVAVMKLGTIGVTVKIIPPGAELPDDFRIHDDMDPEAVVPDAVEANEGVEELLEGVEDEEEEADADTEEVEADEDAAEIDEEVVEEVLEEELEDEAEEGADAEEQEADADADEEDLEELEEDVEAEAEELLAEMDDEDDEVEDEGGDA